MVRLRSRTAWFAGRASKAVEVVREVENTLEHITFYYESKCTEDSCWREILILS